MYAGPFSPGTVSEGPRTGMSYFAPSLPEIEEDESFADLVRTLSAYIEDVIDLPHTWEHLRAAPGTRLLKPLIASLAENFHKHNIVSAFLILKWHYSNLEPDERGINESRANACELVAWRLLSHLSERDLIDCLLYELPPPDEPDQDDASDVSRDGDSAQHPRTPIKDVANEYTGLLSSHSPYFERQASNYSQLFGTNGRTASVKEVDPTLPFVSLNALEIAAVADAKKFMSQRIVQRIVNGIWCGDIIFWDSLNAQTKKKAQKYNKRKPVDPYSRLRVPKYQKIFEAVFFATFLALYYAVLLERHPERLGFFEVLLYIWIAAFAYEEIGEFRDAGHLFYAADFWSLWDLCIILVGIAFMIARIIGFIKSDTREIMDISFDILSLEALFLVPRTCALLSLHPYFGTLVPCLKEMTKDFIKFLGIVIILYMGFLTTFTLLARDEFTFGEMSWTLIKVFFG
ncbi:hypothetical protein MMC30_003697 [Trapelia coarctata]|nr:hypothetical protein [Trapelia coarctata]